MAVAATYTLWAIKACGHFSILNSRATLKPATAEMGEAHEAPGQMAKINSLRFRLVL